MQCTVTESWSAISIGHKKFVERNHERVPEEGSIVHGFSIVAKGKEEREENDYDTEKT